jgi:hypothetical protein
MKQVLSLLMAFVFLQTQTWALSGGPFGGAGSGGTLTGTYAGVLVPEVAVVGGSASIGLFTLVQPDAGLAAGTITVFVNGAAFAGTISGVMDPKNGSFSGVVDAQSTFQVSVLVPTVPPTVQAFDVFAQGTMEAEVTVDSTPSNFSTLASTPSRIEGTAALDIFFQIAADGTPVITQTAIFEVDGFKQSD